MSTFSVTSGSSPVLSIKLNAGEDIISESDSMLFMDSCIELTGEMRGGLISALSRRFLQDESFFQQKIHANKDGNVTLSPSLPGEVNVEKITNGKKLYLNDGAFLCADSTVIIKNVTQSLGRSLFGGTGGFFIMEASGEGNIAFSSFGDMIAFEILPGQDVLVDNSHVVAWEASLSYEVSVKTAKAGFLSGVINSIKSGEGVVNKFYASDKKGIIYISTRNKNTFLGWIAQNILPKN